MIHPAKIYSIYEAKEFDINGPIPPGDVIFIDGKSYAVNEKWLEPVGDGWDTQDVCGYFFPADGAKYGTGQPPELRGFGTSKKRINNQYGGTTNIYGLNILD